MKKHVSITIQGNLKQSGLRFLVVEKGLELELTGNVSDYEGDTLKIEAEGETENLQQFLKWCHGTIPGVEIKKVDYTSTDNLENYETFAAKWFV